MFLRKNPAKAESHIKMALMDGKLPKERHKGFLVVLREYISRVDAALRAALSSQVHGIDLHNCTSHHVFGMR